jgi:hypothetical protein
LRLLGHAVSDLRQLGFEVYIHRRVPPNDGGLSLGQAVVANQILGVESGAGPSTEKTEVLESLRTDWQQSQPAWVA